MLNAFKSKQAEYFSSGRLFFEQARLQPSIAVEGLVK
jgi:hypothetical protein